MNVFDQTTQFLYNPNANIEGDSDFSGILEIYIHHARNIHNICIYDDQDVYAKFSLTYNPDVTLTTKIINGGGKNPEFNECLVMNVTQFDALLKCEMWMLSRAKNYMEDQLLGFALVPIPLVAGKGKITKDFSISSTDLFHSPAGTVKLSLSLDTHVPLPTISDSAVNCSITSEVLLLDRRISQVVLDPDEFSRIEFPDINVARENQQMVTQYFNLEEHGSVSRQELVGSGSFLCLGASNQAVDDCEMTANSSEDNGVSPAGSVQNSGFLSSTMTSLSGDRNSGDSMDKKSLPHVDLLNSLNQSITTEAIRSGACPDTATSRKGSEIRDAKEAIYEDNNNERRKEKYIVSQAFTTLGNMNLEAEESTMQQQIVDMYMRGMQQFSDSLEKMKLPMDLSKPKTESTHDNIIRNHNNNVKVEQKKDASRVFYGSRAFF